MSTLTSLNDIVQSARITKILASDHLAAPIGLQLAWAEVVPAGTGPSIVIARRQPLAVPAGTKVENDEFALVNTSTDGATITAGYVGYTDRVSDEVSYDAVVSAVANVVMCGMNHIADRIDADILALGATAATDSDFTDDPLTQARLLVAQADFKANQPHPGPVGVALGYAQMRDLKQDILDNGGSHLGGDMASAEAKELLKLSAGYEGTLFGMNLFSSSNVVAAAGNNTGFICKMGLEGALAYRVWELPNIEYDRQPRRTAWELTVKARYGVGISAPLNVHAIISRSV